MQTSRWPISKLPIAHLEPFPYHKGELYVELLDRLAKYVTDQLHPNLRETVEEMVEELEHILALQHGKYVEGIQDFQRIHDAFMEDVNSALKALNDTAITDLVNDPGSVFGSTMKHLFAERRIQDTSTPTIAHSEYGIQDGDTDALQTAVDTMPEHHILTIPNHYRFNLTDTLRIRRSVGLRGGTYHGSGVMFETNAPNTVFEDMTIYGEGAQQQHHDPTFRGIYFRGSSINRVSGRVSNVTIRDIGYRGIHVSWGDNILIENCDIRHFRYAGIAFTSVNNSVIRRNTIKHGESDMSVNHNSYGISVSNSASDGMLARSHNVEVSHNVVEDIRHWEGIDTHNGVNIDIHHNIVKGCRRGIALVANMDEPRSGPSDCRVTNNYVDGAGASTQIHGGHLGITMAGSTDRTRLTDGIITGNTVVNTPEPILFHENGQFRYDYDKCVVENNVGDPGQKVVSTRYHSDWMGYNTHLNMADGVTSNQQYQLRVKVIADGNNYATIIRGAVTRNNAGLDLFQISTDYLLPPDMAYGPEGLHIVGTVSTTNSTSVGLAMIDRDGWIKITNMSGELSGSQRVFYDICVYS